LSEKKYISLFAAFFMHFLIGLPPVGPTVCIAWL
jgi:hypothetical protein